MNRQDFETGLILGLVSPPVPHVVRPVPKGDILDNEWPIEWTMRGTADNKAYIQGIMNMRKISDAVYFDYAKAAVAVTAMPDSGGEVVFTTKNIGVTDWELGVLIYIQCTYNGTTYVLGLSVVEKPGTFGNVEFEKGTYYAFMDSSYQSIQFSDADVRFKMTAPLPIAYSYNGVILPALPEWDREKYPYVMISNNGYTDYEDYTHCLLVAHKTLPTTKNNIIQGDKHGVPDSTDYVYSSYDPTHYPDGWHSSENGYGACSSSNGGGGLAMVKLAHVIWANYDVVNTDGSIYLAKSDPKPVYE